MDVGQRCRCDDLVDDPPNSSQLLAVVVLAAIGLGIGRTLILHAPDPPRLAAGNRAQVDLWAALIGILCGYGLAAGLVMTRWLVRILKLFMPSPPWSWLRWLVITGVILTGTTLVVLSIPIRTSSGGTARPYHFQQEGVSLAMGLLALPGLVSLLALRSFATRDSQWDESAACQVRMAGLLRQQARRVLATLGLFLTLLVITTAARRQLVLALFKNALFPQEYVLLLGLVFAGILALFHLPATIAIDRRCDRILDQLAPLPDPGGPNLSETLARRRDLASLLGSGASWQSSFQNAVVVFSPLFTALIGTAVAK